LYMQRANLSVQLPNQRYASQHPVTHLVQT
jgi:hypothetical protein